MAGELKSRFRVATEIPKVHDRRGTTRLSGASLEVAEYILEWDRDSADPDDRYRVIECVDEKEAHYLQQVVSNASHCAAVNHGTRFIYNACKRGLLVFIVRKRERPRFARYDY